MPAQLSSKANLADYLNALSKQIGFDLNQVQAVIKQLNAFLLNENAKQESSSTFVEKFASLSIPQEVAHLIMRKASFELARTVAAQNKVKFSSLRRKFAAKLPNSGLCCQVEEVENETSMQVQRLSIETRAEEHALRAIANRMEILLTKGIAAANIQKEEIGLAHTFRGVFIRLFIQEGLSDLQAIKLVGLIPRDLARKLTPIERSQKALLSKFKESLGQHCRRIQS